MAAHGVGGQCRGEWRYPCGQGCGDYVGGCLYWYVNFSFSLSLFLFLGAGSAFGTGDLEREDLLMRRYRE